MSKASTIVALFVAALVAALAALNWPTLTAPAPLDLVVAQVEAPLGVVMLGVAAVLAGLFFIAHLTSQIGSLMEARRLLKEIQRVQALADQAEASRIESLHQFIGAEFRLMHDRLNAVGAGSASRAAREPAPAALRDVSPLSSTEAVIER